MNRDQEFYFFQEKLEENRQYWQTHCEKCGSYTGVKDCDCHCNTIHDIPPKKTHPGGTTSITAGDAPFLKK